MYSVSQSKLKKQKSLLVIALVSGILAILCGIFGQVLQSSIGNIFGDSSAQTSIGMSAFVLMAVYWGSLISSGLFAVSFIYGLACHERYSANGWIIGAVQMVILVCAVLLMPFAINLINAMNGSWTAMFNLGTALFDAGSLITKVYVMAICGVISLIFSVLFLTKRSSLFADMSGSSSAEDEAGPAFAAFDNAVMFVLEHPKKALLGAGAAVIAIAGCAGVWWLMEESKRTDINLMSSCEVQYSGYDGSGEATVACIPEFDEHDPNRRDKVDEFLMSVSYIVEPASGLSNGQEVTVRADFDQEQAKSLKLNVISEDSVQKAEGLPVAYDTYDKIPADLVKELKSRALKKVDSASQKHYSNKTIFRTVKNLISADVAGTWYNFTENTLDKKYEGTLYFIIKAEIGMALEEQWGFSKQDPWQETVFYLVTVSHLTPEGTADTLDMRISEESTTFASANTDEGLVEYIASYLPQTAEKAE